MLSRLAPYHGTTAKGASLAAAFVVTLAPTIAAADEADAKKLMHAMSDYLAAQGTFAFDYDATLDVVSVDKEKLGVAWSGAISMKRPDQIHVTRQGGFANLEMNFDGKTLSLLGKDANLYLQEEIPGTVDNLIDVLRDTYGRPLPAADLLSANTYDILMADVTESKDLGSGFIGGKECDHLAFRTPDVDWQIWIAQGDAPLPCRYVITSRTADQAPQYTVQFSNWSTQQEPAADAFTFAAPEGATKIDLKSFGAQVPELPSNLSMEQPQ